MSARRVELRRLVLCMGLGVVAAAITGRVSAAEQWIRLRAPSFGVVSQLDADDTRKWAVEFEQFIDSMHQLYSVENVALPPLTMVLFKQPKEFQPYRMQTDSGQAKVAGFFTNVEAWSVIGLAGRADDDLTRAIIQHEAVHWFASAGSTSVPMWFEEGLAETLSTFKISDGKGLWGRAIDNHAAYLAQTGLIPLDQFFRASQDEVFHGKGGSRYYPQAWLFTHYLIFGNGGAGPENVGAGRKALGEFLRLQSETDLDSAFHTAFGKPYEEVTDDLRSYLRRGRYGYAQTELRDRGDEMVVEPASPANVEFALARLAAAGGNYELANAHIDKVLEIAPSSPLGYDLRAFVAYRMDDADQFAAAADLAIERRSEDALVYRVKAERLVADQSRESSWDDLLSPDVARAAADLYTRAIVLNPRSRDSYAGLMTALLNVSALTDNDRVLVNNGRVLFPTEGLMLVGEAALEKHDGNERAAVLLLRKARNEPFVLRAAHRQSVNALHANWTVQWVAEEFQEGMRTGDFAAARVLLDEQLTDDGVAGGLRTTLQRMRDDLPHVERIKAAEEALLDGNVAEARATLTAIVDDSAVSENVRGVARRLLQRIDER